MATIKTTASTTRVAIYARYSSEMQAPSSIEDQERSCRDYARRQGWSVVLFASDAAVRAGAEASRVGYQAIVAAAREGRFDVLLIEEMSRFSRKYMGGHRLLADLLDLGVDVADTSSGVIDLRTQQGQLGFAIKISGSHAEKRNLALRVKRGLHGQTLKGFISGGVAPFGLEREPVFSESVADLDGRAERIGVRLKENPREVATLRRIFEMYDAGTPKSAIARALNREGHRGRQGGAWSAGTISSVLANPIYIGKRVWNRTSRSSHERDELTSSGKARQRDNDTADWVVVDNFGPAVLAPELFERVQSRLAADRAVAAKRGTVNSGRQYLLTGLLRCASCGGSLSITIKRRDTSLYCCPFLKRGVCDNRTRVPRAGVEGRVRFVLDALTKNDAMLESLVVDHNRRIDSINAAQNGQIRDLEGEREAVVRERDNLVGVIASIGATARSATLVKAMEAREARLDELDARLAHVRATLQPLLVPRLSVPDLREGSGSLFDGDDSRSRGIVSSLVSAVLVYATGEIVLQLRSEAILGNGTQLRLLDPDSEVRAAPADEGFHIEVSKDRGEGQYVELRGLRPDLSTARLLCRSLSAGGYELKAFSRAGLATDPAKLFGTSHAQAEIPLVSPEGVEPSLLP